MRSLILALSLLLLASTAWAKTGVGFHSRLAPVGGRLQLAEYYALDANVGLVHRDDQDTWSFDVGLPITLKEWTAVKAHLRPGLFYQEREGQVTARTLSAEIEGEAFLVKDFSVSASFGVARDHLNDETVLRTTGGEFTNVGFHLYLF